MDDKLIVGQRHTEAARELAEYAGFKFAADHLDMALDATAEAFARFERDNMTVAGTCDICAGKCRGHSVGRPEEWEPEAGSKATPTPVSAAVEERAREIAEIIDPEAFKGPIWMDRAGSDDAAPARMAAALKKARDIMGLAATKDDPGYFYQEVQHGMNATAALTNAQPIRAGLTQRAMMQRINEAIRMLDWCIENHYAPDSSREVAAVAGLREVKKSFPAALATPDDALTERAGGEQP